MGCQCIGMGITVKMSFEEKSQQEIGKLTNIDYSEKENGPRASSAPALGLNTIIFKHVFWYMQQISGERLQDHWSSGFQFILNFILSNCVIEMNISHNVKMQSVCNMVERLLSKRWGVQNLPLWCSVRLQDT